MSTTTIEFKAWPKIPRLSKSTMFITEKLDGTNACVIVTEEGEVAFQSRKRIITPENDNYGFAAWGTEHREELLRLGPGYHFGEWWGLGIQRGYCLDEKRFSLFDTRRRDEELPACVSTVPLIRTHQFDTEVIGETVEELRRNGSFAAPGFMNPEGVVVYDPLTRSIQKVLCHNDDIPKGLAQ